MRKTILAGLLAVLALGIIAGAANAERIIVENIEAGGLNYEVQGRITFESAIVTIICDKSMAGHLNQTSEGTLGLRRNEAGVIKEVRVSNCRNGEAIPLIKLERSETWVRLSWVRAERGIPGRAQLNGENAAFLIRAIGVSCLYLAELTATSTSDANGNYTTVELRLLNERSIRLVSESPAFGFCPTTGIRMIGELRAVRPASIRIRLEV